MPITLNTVTGLIDAAVVDDNFGELENFLKENVGKDDFEGKFDKYKIRRYTGGKITSFNTGSKPISNERSTGLTSTFENNWLSGTGEISHIDHGDAKNITDYVVNTKQNKRTDTLNPNRKTYTDPLNHPFELLGYPGGSLYYDFQEQGFADPTSLYDGRFSTTASGWPPSNSPLDRFPKDECWSRWLTIPDAAGGVYVEEPCVAVITANVFGNYFFTPNMRLQGINTGIESRKPETGGASFLTDDGTYYDERYFSHWKVGGKATSGIIQEGMQHSAMLRLGLFADTNPIVWDDEFVNGDAFGNLFTDGSGHGYNPWIGSDPDGAYAAEIPAGVATRRSWVKVTDLTYRVRQRHCYKVIGVVRLKGRRRYNFSLKFRPAMTFGYVEVAGGHHIFNNRYAELNSNTRLVEQHPDAKGNENPGWQWGSDSGKKTHGMAWFYPGGDSLATNLIESSALSVDFFYGQRDVDNLNEAGDFTPLWNPGV